MLLPSAEWKWTTDKQSKELVVELDAGLRFKTAYQQKHLKHIPENLLFDVQHCQHFMECVEAVEASGVPFEDASKLQIGLNATAALNFHKPVLNKSWLYDKSDSCITGPEKQLAWLCDQGNSYLVLTLAKQGDTVLTMNLSDTFKTNDAKNHPQFSLISVLTDRLLRFESIETE